MSVPWFEAEEVEAGSDEELALRGVWLSRVMFGWMLDPALAFNETRSYEQFLEARGVRLA